MTESRITRTLFELQDLKYAAGQRNIIPNVSPDRIIGVRTPALRDLAKKLYGTGEAEDFIRDLPHRYFDEDQLHAFIISLEKDPDRCMEEVETFLPYIDNWATCDQLSPRVFRRYPEKLLPHIRKWIGSGETYTIRFGAGMLMEHFLGENFRTEYADMVAGIESEEYYVNMMRAWYFATALAKQYEAVIPYIEEKRLDDWTHNKVIQKSIESYRITDEQKQYLRTLKVGKNRR
ncbi:MAG: DNA alkylation repair protein [Clostridia bacterium]|nr:DNA alkylation repair protein [Clostridia bacterium]